MTKKIDELQVKIGTDFDSIIPTDYEKAYMFFEYGPGVCSSFWFCYIDKATGKVIPADRLEDRKDIIINDATLYNNTKFRIMIDLCELQKLYVAATEKLWYGITYELDSDGNFDISFSYDKPTGSLQERREKWCMEHLGIMPPTVTADMLRK